MMAATSYHSCWRGRGARAAVLGALAAVLAIGILCPVATAHEAELDAASGDWDDGDEGYPGEGWDGEGVAGGDYDDGGEGGNWGGDEEDDQFGGHQGHSHGGGDEGDDYDNYGTGGMGEESGDAWDDEEGGGQPRHVHADLPISLSCDAPDSEEEADATAEDAPSPALVRAGRAREEGGGESLRLIAAAVYEIPANAESQVLRLL